jgi:hypothetical protein
MKRLFFKIILALIPALLLGSVYLVLDPFMVIRHYNNLYRPQQPHLELNEDYVATEYFLETYPSQKYDSYVFGSSRARFFNSQNWSRHINSSAIYPYNVALENLFGVAGKVKFLHNKGVKIKNALMIVDEQLLAGARNSSGHLYCKHPLVSGESAMDFQFASFKDFFNLDAISLYIKALKKGVKVEEDPQYVAERLIARDPNAYYGPKMAGFYPRTSTQQYSKPVLEAANKKLLLDIKKVFSENGTDYRIVISPLYDQKRLAPEDLQVLQEVFDKNRIYDFSGINDITSNVYNYYEATHFRQPIAQRILDTVYAASNKGLSSR